MRQPEWAGLLGELAALAVEKSARVARRARTAVRLAASTTSAGASGGFGPALGSSTEPSMESAASMASGSSTFHPVDPSVVHMFWDHSNLFVRAQDTCDPRNGAGKEPGQRLALRLDFGALFGFAACGRTVEKAVAVGSVPPGMAAIWERLGNAGLIVDLQERGAASGKEQGVDQALQLEMMRSLVDRKKPAVAVLLTGDGGFRADVDRLLDAGWGVEVLSFSNGFSPKLRRISTGHGGRGKYVDLDPWYDQLTYLQDVGWKVVRPAKQLDLAQRPKI